MVKVLAQFLQLQLLVLFLISGSLCISWQNINSGYSSDDISFEGHIVDILVNFIFDFAEQIITMARVNSKPRLNPVSIWLHFIWGFISRIIMAVDFLIGHFGDAIMWRRRCNYLRVLLNDREKFWIKYIRILINLRLINVHGYPCDDWVPELLVVPHQDFVGHLSDEAFASSRPNRHRMFRHPEIMFQIRQGIDVLRFILFIFILILNFLVQTIRLIFKLFFLLYFLEILSPPGIWHINFIRLFSDTISIWSRPPSLHL